MGYRLNVQDVNHPEIEEELAPCGKLLGYFPWEKLSCAHYLVDNGKLGEDYTDGGFDPDIFWIGQNSDKIRLTNEEFLTFMHLYEKDVQMYYSTIFSWASSMNYSDFSLENTSLKDILAMPGDKIIMWE